MEGKNGIFRDINYLSCQSGTVMNGEEQVINVLVGSLVSTALFAKTNL